MDLSLAKLNPDKLKEEVKDKSVSRKSELTKIPDDSHDMTLREEEKLDHPLNRLSKQFKQQLKKSPNMLDEHFIETEDSNESNEIEKQIE